MDWLMKLRIGFLACSRISLNNASQKLSLRFLQTHLANSATCFLDVSVFFYTEIFPGTTIIPDFSQEDEKEDTKYVKIVL